MTHALLDRPAPWLAGDGPEAASALWSQGWLLRNFADFSFPAACSDDERRAVEERVMAVLQAEPFADRGQYWPMGDLSKGEALFLAERRLIPFDLVRARAHAGVYLFHDQTASITINGTDHVCLTVLASGLQLPELWTQMDELDNALSGNLDFAFSKRFGYLTASLGHVGTGLKAGVVLHLPALGMSSGIAGLVQMARQRRQAIHGLKPTVIAPASPAPPLAPAERKPRLPQQSEGFYNDLSGAMYGDVNEAQGDLYVLTNLATLGTLEEEILFHLRRTASEIVGREKTARETLLGSDRRTLEDRVARAVGIARHARMLGLTEALGLVSSLRLGLETNLATGYSLENLNGLSLAVQSAHIRLAAGHDCDEYTLTTERADLFRRKLNRARFSSNSEG